MPVRPIQLNNSMPLYLPYDKRKPCLSLKFLIEDFRYVMFKINFINNKLNDMVSILLYLKFIKFSLRVFFFNKEKSLHENKIANMPKITRDGE